MTKELLKEHLLQTIERMQRPSGGLRDIAGNMGRVCLVYSFQKLENGLCIPVNRLYKPIGLALTTCVSYYDFDYLHINPKELHSPTMEQMGYMWESDSKAPYWNMKNLRNYRDRVDAL